MTPTSERLAAFEAKWRARLEAGARILFAPGRVPALAGSPAKVADEWVQSNGLKPIGFNWEMLDPAAAAQEPRSAIGALSGALECDMAFPQREWLGGPDARACAADFVSAFDPALATILTNRMEHGWHPVSDAQIEWAFVGYDEAGIALLLLTRD